MSEGELKSMIVQCPHCSGSLLVQKDRIVVYQDKELKDFRKTRKKVGAVGGVYGIINEDGTRIKIGKSWNVKKRLKTLQQANSGKLEIKKIFALENSGARAFEQNLHQRFKDYRLHGEWYKYEGEVRDFFEPSDKKA